MTTARRCVVPVALLIVASSLLGCRSEAEQVVETWEELGNVIAESGDDCDALAEELSSFSDEHGGFFASDMTPIYEEIMDDPELWYRMERALADIQADDFACRDHAEVQKVSRELFAGLIDAVDAEE